MDAINKVTLSELRHMSEEKRAHTFRQLADATRRAPTDALIQEVEDKVRSFEAVYGLDSETMKRRVGSGKLRETREVCDWLMVLHLRDRLVGVGSKQ